MAVCVKNRLQEMQRAEPVVQEHAQSIVEAEGPNRKTVEMMQVGRGKTAILE